MSPELAGRFVRESVSEYSEFALPTDANTLGNVLGGKVMHLVDLAAALAAVRHARCPVVTASVDQMSFLHPVHIGQLIMLQSSVNRVFRTSMEVGVRVRGGGSAHRSPQAHLVRILDVRRDRQERTARSDSAGDSRD